MTVVLSCLWRRSFLKVKSVSFMGICANRSLESLVLRRLDLLVELVIQGRVVFLVSRWGIAVVEILFCRRG
jgi:hypothetical protein